MFPHLIAPYRIKKRLHRRSGCAIQPGIEIEEEDHVSLVQQANTAR
jgi:hypothetical protein